jgi:Tol biopolymer transport system component
MTLSVGTRIASYEIVGWLGAGGMGEVYRAHDSRLRRDVAIKLIAGNASMDADRLRRFDQEALAAGQINHPNILTVYDSGTHEGLPFVVSELLEGETLRSRLQRGPLAVATAVAWGQRLAEGLAAAHDKGIVHRDIKPENLFITADGRLKVLDFGVAKLAQGDRGSANSDTTEGGVIGTAAYMSPEQTRGERVDGRTDIFSIGAILYEMLTGGSPFARGTAADTAVAILRDEPPPVPGVPPLLAAIVGRCLEKRPEVRFQSARDLAFALGHMTISNPVSPTRHTRPHREMWLAAATVLVAVLLITALLGARRRPAATVEQRFADARVTRLIDWEGSEGQAAISADGRSLVFLSDRDGEFDVWYGEIGTGRFRKLTSRAEEARPPGTTLRLLGFPADGSTVWSGAGERSMFIPVGGGSPQPFLRPRTGAVAWSPDGSRLAYFENADGDPLFVSDRTGGDEREIFPAGGAGMHTHNPAWSPDGRWIYFVHGPSVASSFQMDIWRVRPTGESPEQLTHLKTVMFVAPLDQRTIAFIARAPDQTGPWLWLLDVATGSIHRVLTGLDQYLSVSAARDGRHLVTTVANPITRLAQIAIGGGVAAVSAVEPYAEVPGSARAPRFGRSTLLYLAAPGAADGLWRLHDGIAAEVWNGRDGTPIGPAALSPDESTIAIGVRRDGETRLMIMSADGTRARSVAPTLVPDGTADWSPDGRSIVTGGIDTGSAGLFTLDADGTHVVRLLSGQAANPIWSSDGALILYDGPIVGGVSELRGVRPDGTPVAIPAARARPGGHRFLGTGRRVIYQSNLLEFELLDLADGTTRPLTSFGLTTPLMSGRTFDVTPDGKRLVFEQSTERSDIALIELPPWQ